MNSDPAANSPGDRPLLHGVDWAVRAGVADEVILATRRLVRRRRQRRAMAGLLTVTLVGVGFWYALVARPSAMPPTPAPSAVVSMPVQRVLPDGTMVQLKDDAEISVAYSPAVRRVVLLRGEAHFEVRHDSARPFIVAVDSVEVRAVGTAFVVQRRAADVEVLVT